MRNDRLRKTTLRALAMAFALAGLAWTAAWAQGLNLDDFGKSGEPVVINAEGGIEWQRDRRVYVARQNASAQRGQVTVYGDVLTAHYREDAQGQNEIWRVEADGNVRIVSATDTAYGDDAVYDVNAGILVLKGRNLRLVSKDGVLTARDSLEYWQNQDMAVARGAAEVVSEDRTLKGDTLVTYFVKDQAGNSQMQRIDAFGNVEVISDQDVARGERGTYNVESGIANLFGSVKITRGENQLSGEQGVLDTNTGVSKLLPAPSGSGGSPRVRGVIVPPPESGDKAEDTAKDAADDTAKNTGVPPSEKPALTSPDPSVPPVK